MNVVSIPLPPTRSYVRRSVLWVGNAVHADGRLGTLTIPQSGRKPRSAMAVESYAVHGHPERAAAGTRVFTLAKIDGSRFGDLYWLVIDDADAGRDTCTCDAGKFKPKCKHKEAVRTLLADGSLEASHAS